MGAANEKLLVADLGPSRKRRSDTNRHLRSQFAHIIARDARRPGEQGRAEEVRVELTEDVMDALRRI